MKHGKYTRQIENQQVPRSLDTEAIIIALSTIHLEFNERHFVARVLFDYYYYYYYYYKMY